MSDSVLLAGSSNPELAKKISKFTSIPLLPVSIARFPDSEISIQLNESVSGKTVFILQSIAKDPNEHLVETLLLVDATRRSQAKHIVLVSPYLAYSRQCVQQGIGSSVAARLFANFLQVAGAGSLITMDLHQETVTSFYDFPVKHLSAQGLFADELIRQQISLNDAIVVGPDLGSAKLVAKLAKALNCPLALIEKRRIDARKVEMLSLIGDVRDKNVLLADDVCSTAGTLTSAANVCHGKGAKSIVAVVTHGLFVEEALERIVDSPIERLYVTDSVKMPHQVLACPKIHVISVAKSFASALIS